MSCFVRIATQIVDEASLREAIVDRGYEIKKSRAVRGWQDAEESADIVFDAGSANYDVGAVRGGDGTFSFVADWEMARIDRDQYVGQLTQAYGVARVTQAAKKAGFVIAGKKVDEKGSVKMTLRRFV